ncbi:unnamed protein product [Parascedosporium putredinis]|uniref:HIT domain-containing protein n=1 Tax=Parascedosporium putredinis TaxID=1442378 RepID=A0A9P1M8R7_9PEZI|nr:unnamed protein product [Parascedosporium putredinis]CAI7989429.1 unnamed protein product [Parascedosporium putredinis]
MHTMASIDDPNCPFCNIAANYAPYAPASPPSSPLADDSPISPTKTAPETHIVLSTPTVMAFLDIMPLQPFHILLCPRSHRPRLTNVSRDEAAEMGQWLAVLSHAVVKVTGSPDWNVGQREELDDDEGRGMAELLREAVAELMREEEEVQENEGKGEDEDSHVEQALPKREANKDSKL